MIMAGVILFETCSKKPLGLLKKLHNIIDSGQNEEATELSFYKVGNHTFYCSGVVQDISVLIRLIRSRWYCIQDTVLNNNSIPLIDIISSREFLNKAFTFIITGLKQDSHNNSDEELMKILKLFRTYSSSIVEISELSDNVKSEMKYARQDSCPFYHYFHTLLEQYFYLMVLYSVCKAKIEDITEHLEKVISNLLLLYKVNSKASCSLDMCKCVTFFWLAIQLLTEKYNVADNLFWKAFNRVLEKEDPLTSLGFLKEFASIQRFNTEFEDIGSKCNRIKPNYNFLELKLRELLSQSNSDQLIIGFRLVQPLICDLWLKDGKIDILQIIWEFYSKRLNVSSKSVNNASALNIIETLDTIMFCPTDCTEDFELFVGLLLCHLKEYPVHWGKMKGRIYSQLGPNKVKDLTDIGIRHVMILFLALSNIHFEEVQKKVLTFLDNLPKERKYTPLVWNMYAALVLKYVREGRSIEQIAPPLVHMLQEASTNQKFFHLIKDLIKNLQSVVNHSANMQLHQWLLFDSWLGRYQSVCYVADLNSTLNLILLLLQKCNNADSWSHWENFFKEIVYCNLKQLALTSTSPAIIGKIAGELALCYNNLANEAFSFFCDTAVSPKITSVFLEVIMNSYPDCLILSSQQENIILESWIRVCFLTTENQEELTRNIIKLDVFPLVLKNQLKVASDPIESFIEYLSNNSRQCNMESRNDILQLCNLAFGDLDKILLHYLSNPDNEQIVVKMYRYVSLICLRCGNLIYNRNKSVTILTKLIQVLLLPMDFLVGKKSLHNFILNALKRTWSSFFDAFIKLNSVRDPYLERTLKDMVVKYLPYFSTVDSPIVSCLEDLKMADVILDKISISYFKPPVKESDANLLKALKIVSDLVTYTTSVSLFKLAVVKTLHGLFEVVIFHSQRSSAIGVIKHITTSSLFPHVEQEFRQTIVAVTEKYMALNTINYFQLLICLAKFAPNDIKNLLDDIKIHVGNVERLRGVGFDKTLRLHLERLENSLQTDS